MADEQIGILRAVWRFVTFYGLRKRLGIVRAADLPSGDGVRAVVVAGMGGSGLAGEVASAYSTL